MSRSTAFIVDPGEEYLGKGVGEEEGEDKQTGQIKIQSCKFFSLCPSHFTPGCHLAYNIPL